MNRVQEAIGDYLIRAKRVSGVCSDDIALVATLSDLDACFCKDEDVVSPSSIPDVSTCYDAASSKIRTNNVPFVQTRNKNKTEALNILATESFVKVSEKNIVPFHAFYCGMNLEHALYGISSYVTAEQKGRLARQFSRDHKTDALKFEDAIVKIPALSRDYELSWKESDLRKVPFERLSNLSSLLDWLMQIFKAQETSDER